MTLYMANSFHLARTTKLRLALRGRGRARVRLRLKNENEVRGRDFEENLVLDRSFLLPLNRSEAPNRPRPRARPRPRILLGRTENIKDREPLSRPANPDLASPEV
jgi:hypothetical protein